MMPGLVHIPALESRDDMIMSFTSKAPGCLLPWSTISGAVPVGNARVRLGKSKLALEAKYEESRASDSIVESSPYAPAPAWRSRLLGATSARVSDESSLILVLSPGSEEGDVGVRRVAVVDVEVEDEDDEDERRVEETAGVTASVADVDIDGAGGTARRRTRVLSSWFTGDGFG